MLGRTFCVRFSGKTWLNFNLTPYCGTSANCCFMSKLDWFRSRFIITQIALHKAEKILKPNEICIFLKPQQSFGSVVCFSIGITCFSHTFIHALIPRTQCLALTAKWAASNIMLTEPVAFREKTDSKVSMEWLTHDLI